MDKQKLDNLKDYIRKLKKIVMHECDLNLIRFQLYNKSKLDDVMCCIIACLPENYKKAIHDNRQKLSSVVAFRYLSLAVKNKFVFNPNLCSLKRNDVEKYIDLLLLYIEKDIGWVETHEF